MIGNVWEWIDGEVNAGMYNNRLLPDGGYVSVADSAGIVLETTQTPHIEFGNDYALTSKEGVKGMIRGGFYGSGDDAGIFAQNLSVPLDFRSAGIGFRCVKDI
jgi:formylglycine-generating enzyme required for sulfatase activity